MPRRASKWVIHEHSDDNWELSKGNRGLYFGMKSRKEALQRLMVHYKPGESVFHEAPDGYLTNITNLVRKGGLIN
jgi:hypothetical protein